MAKKFNEMNNCHHKSTAIIVTYLPDRLAVNNINKISRVADLTIVVDNTCSKKSPEGIERNNVIIVKNCKNVGLAEALNRGMSIAALYDHQNIFLFDQDTDPPKNYIPEMIAFKQEMEKRNNSLAIFVPRFFDTNCKTFSKFPLVSKYYFKHITCPVKKIEYEKYAVIAITSGTLISPDKFKIIGPFQSDYFIDFLDNEYCLRLKSKGFNCAINCQLTINHSIGRRIQKKFLGIVIKPNNHNSFRRYYIGKNGIRTALKYFNNYPSYALLIFIRIIHELLSIILFEKSKNAKISALSRGFIKGLSYITHS